MSFTEKPFYNMADLIKIVELLRNPKGGCPWDIEQTHSSIKMNLLEEAYETVDAIEQQSAEHLCEELGDLLLQIALHSQMETENGAFSFDDVCDGICKKLIYRHPHVFKSLIVSSSNEVMSNWEKLKRDEKNRHSLKSDINDIPKNFPALMRAAKVQKRAEAHGLNNSGIKAALSELKNDVIQLEESINANDGGHEKLGELLLGTVRLARTLKLDAEQALTDSTTGFIKRVLLYEEKANEKGGADNLSPEQKAELWGLTNLGFTAK